MLLGGTPALSKQALCYWLDMIITGVAKDEVRVYNLNGVRQDGLYHQLKQNEFSSILGQLSNLYQWGSECTAAAVSCGTFYMMTPSGRGMIHQQAIVCGPFQ